MLLALDTAWSACSVALATEDREIVSSRHKAQRRGQAETLVPMIGEVLAEAGKAPGDIDKIILTTGPGTFAGVRVGVAAARTLMLAIGAAALGVSSFEALAATLAANGKVQPGETVLALVPGKRGEVSAEMIEIGAAGILKSLKKPETVALETLAGWVGPGAVVAAGPDLENLLSGTTLKPKAMHDFWPSAPDLIASLPAFEAKAFSRELKPFYLRPADAKPQKKAFS